MNRSTEKYTAKQYAVYSNVAELAYTLLGTFVLDPSTNKMSVFCAVTGLPSEFKKEGSWDKLEQQARELAKQLRISSFTLDVSTLLGVK